jgi:outer membrane protein assembly factor BamB
MRNSLVLVASLCVILVLSLVFIPFASADWSMYRSDPSRSGVGTGYMGFAPTVLWKSNITWELVQTKIDFEEHTWTTPAVVNGVVYICSSSHVKINSYNHLWWSDAYALNAINGAEIWDYRINSSTQMSAPAVVNGVVYFGSDDNKVYALSASNGALFWNPTIANIGHSSPAVVDSVVYIGGYNGNVYALKAAFGTKVWNFTDGKGTGSSPVVVDGTVISARPSGIYALSAENGAVIWNYSNSNVTFGSDPVVDNGVLYFGSGDGQVYALGAPSASYPSLGPTASPVLTSNEFSNQLIIITAVMSVAIVLSAVFILRKKKFGNRTIG